MQSNKLLFKCTIPGRAYIKKNGAKRYGNKLVYTPQYSAWAAQARLKVTSEKIKLIKSKTGDYAEFPIKEPIHLRLKFHFKNKQAEADLSNLYEGIQDVLTDMGIIENDKQVQSHDGSRKLFGDEYERLEVEVLHFCNTDLREPVTL